VSKTKTDDLPTSKPTEKPLRSSGWLTRQHEITQARAYKFYLPTDPILPQGFFATRLNLHVGKFTRSSELVPFREEGENHGPEVQSFDFVRIEPDFEPESSRRVPF
jgi:hypothetical protein